MEQLQTRYLLGTKLSEREKQVLGYIMLGFKTRDIADILSISENTVYNHRKKLLKKKGAKTCKQIFAAV